MPIESATNGYGYPHLDQRDEKSRRHPRWTRQENLTLIQAKEITENNPHKGRKISSTLLQAKWSENTQPKWVMISSYCKQQGVNRGPAQCRKRWSNLNGDFKRVKVWESKLTDKADSFWIMRNDVRKENKLPVSLDVELFKVLEGREMGPTGAVSPMPLQAVPAVSEDVGNQYGEDDQDDAEEDEVVSELGNQEQERVAVDNHRNTVDKLTQTDSVVKKNCSPETISDAARKSCPGTNWDSQEKVKRRRISADDHNSNSLEGQILKALVANNKLLNAELESHNQNCQLDRDQKKENNELLMAALGKLTDVLMKIAEKL